MAHTISVVCETHNVVWCVFRRPRSSHKVKLKEIVEDSDDNDDDNPKKKKKQSKEAKAA